MYDTLFSFKMSSGSKHNIPVVQCSLLRGREEEKYLNNAGISSLDNGKAFRFKDVTPLALNKENSTMETEFWVPSTFLC